VRRKEEQKKKEQSDDDDEEEEEEKSGRIEEEPPWELHVPQAAKRPADGKRRKPHWGAEQDAADFHEVLTLLMQLSLAVCSADILDCVAVARNFFPSDITALRDVATKVCHELAVLGGGDSGGFHSSDARGSQAPAPSSSSKTTKRIEALVSTFLTDRLPPLGGRRGSCGGRRGSCDISRRGSDSSWKPYSCSERGSLPGDPTASQKLLKRSNSSHTEISVTSYSEFAKENKSFRYHSEEYEVACAKKLHPMSARRGSCTSSRAYALSKRGSIDESVASGKTTQSRYTQVSTVMRAMLRGQADKSKSVHIGDLTWGMDGVPHQDGSDPNVHKTMALIQRYGGERRPGRQISGGGPAEQLAPNKSSIMAFVMRGSAQPDHLASYCTSSTEESVTTSVLLDHALQGMDIGGHYGRPRTYTQESLKSQRMRRAMSRESYQSSLFTGPVVQGRKRTLTMESNVSRQRSECPMRDAEHEHGGVVEVPRRRNQRSGTSSQVLSSVACDPLCLIEEASAASSSKASKATETKEQKEEEPETALTAQEKWLLRKEEKKKKRSNGRMTYGAIMRNGYEQTLPPGNRGEDGEEPPPPPPGAVEPDHSGASLRMLDSVVEAARAAAPAAGTRAAAAAIGAGSPGVGVEQAPDGGGSAASSSAGSKDEARARWEERRAQKRLARKGASTKTTYGVLIRLEHEQMLAAKAAAAKGGAQDGGGGASHSADGLERKRVPLSSVHFRTHDGCLAGPAEGACEDAGVGRSSGSDGRNSIDSLVRDCHSILKDRHADVLEGRRLARKPARSVEFNLGRNLVYDLQDVAD